MTDHLGRAQERDTGLTVTSSWAHDAIRDWITSVTDDWTEQAEPHDPPTWTAEPLPTTNCPECGEGAKS